MAAETVAAETVAVAAETVAAETVAAETVAGSITPFIEMCEQYSRELPFAAKGEMSRCPSIQDGMNMSKAFHNIKTKPGSYEIFACHHQMSYALYCALDGTVWMFEVDCQTPKTRSIVTLADLDDWAG